MRMVNLMILAAAMGFMAACTTTRTEKPDTVPTNGMMMGPANQPPPQQPIDTVTNPNNQIPSNSPSGRY